MTFMQTVIQTKPAPAPVATPAPGARYVLVGPEGTQALQIPKTADEVRALQEQRSQIGDQLDNVSSRRTDIARELAGTGAESARQGLQARIDILDQRILQLETDLARTGRELSMVSPEVLASTGQWNDRGGDSSDFGEGVAAGGFGVFFFMSIVLLFARRRWKRRVVPARAGALDTDSSQRLQRLEQGMDAIAIEIERVSEGQRFVTKLLADSRGVEPAPR
ncbi:MAG TPA: hypothetical protein VFP77_08745 [Gemmatimonadaceae bacterium]|jgi:hypothetical protein|nr:hypothetical protein [Gemmatimonadaceae bacterium]